MADRNLGFSGIRRILDWQPAAATRFSKEVRRTTFDGRSDIYHRSLAQRDNVGAQLDGFG